MGVWTSAVYRSGLIWILLIQCVFSLRLGAFNLQIFGKSKASKPDVLDTVAKIISRYDIVLLQEIRDSTGYATRVLREKIEAYKDVTSVYKYEISDRLGRTKSKEEYLFVYRADRGISVVDRYHYDDGEEETQSDTFEREPFIVSFRSNRTVVNEFSLVAIHTNPTKALSEIKTLKDVYDDVRQKWNSDDIIILGDLNADCSYVRKKHWPEVAIRTDPRFYWPIGDDVDTTITDTGCAYDRFIIAGYKLQQSVRNNSAGIFDFKKAYRLSKEQALAISDHFPIELDLEEKPVVGQGSSVSWSLGVIAVSTLFVVKLCL